MSVQSLETDDSKIQRAKEGVGSHPQMSADDRGGVTWPGTLLRALTLETLVGLGLLAVMGAALGLILFRPVSHLLTPDGVYVLLLFFGYVAVVILSAFGQWVKTVSDAAMPKPLG